MNNSAKKIASLTPTVLVIDDDELIRRSLKRVLTASNYSVSAHDSLAQFARSDSIPRLGCAILDLNLPDANGLEIQERLSKIVPTLPVIFLSGFGQVSSSVRAMKAGAIDFLEKPVEAQTLLLTVERAIEQSRRLLAESLELDDLRRRFGTLTKREQQVFTLVTSGLLNKQVGGELGITEKTIKVHRAQVMAKMSADSFAELVKLAQRLNLNASEAAPKGLIESEPLDLPRPSKPSE